MTDAKKSKRSLSERLWWFDVVYPITLAMILFFSLTYVVYSGTRQMRMSSIADNILLQWSLKHVDRSLQTPEQIVILTADPRTLTTADRPPHSRLPEPSATLYGDAIRKLAAQQVPLVYLSWDIEAHPSDDPDYIEPLLSAITSVKPTTKVIVAAPYGSIPRFPESFSRSVTIVEDGTCNEPDILQTQCSFDREWSDWVIQSILNNLGEGDKVGQPNPVWVSELLNNSFPSYILNLNAPQDFHRTDLKDFLAGKTRVETPPRIAFIGSDMSGSISSLPEGHLTRRVITAHDPEVTDVSIQGTPLHVFWAQVAQMYIDKATVSIPDERIVIAVVVIFCVFIFAVMWLYGSPASLGMYLVYVAAGPYANALSIRYLNIYIPLFDSYYFGMASFILAGFGHLSFSAFRRWRLEEQMRFHSLTADLKGNFISLLSHNLNTPVAKMQGMLGLLSARPGGEEWNSQLRQAEKYVAQLELGIRGVLIGSALDEGSLHKEARNVQALAREFEFAMGSLRRLGVNVRIASVTADEDDLLFLPLAFDIKVFNATLSAACALFAGGTNQNIVDISLHVTETERGDALRVTVRSDTAWIPPHAGETLCGPYSGNLRTLSGSDFFNDVASGLLRQTVEMYGGQITCTPKDRGGTISFSLIPQA